MLGKLNSFTDWGRYWHHIPPKLHIPTFW